MTFSAEQKVRLIHDPDRNGVITGQSRERAGVVKWQVRFDQRLSWQNENELELIEEGVLDPYVLIQQGRYGKVSQLRRNLTHIQLSGRLANLVYSMDTTNTDFYAYQYKPVLAFLDSPSNGILIADEVGLGKTIEAGLIWTELRAREDARRLVVICPAMLREKWKDELRERFGVQAEIMNADQLVNALQQNKHEELDGKGIICSLQGLRPPPDWEDDVAKDSPTRRLAKLLDVKSDDEAIIDLLIVDEAHYLRNPKTQSAKLGHLIREVSEHVVLLSATPINMGSDDLFHLLNLVDPDSFGIKAVFPRVLDANAPLVKAQKTVLDRRSSSAEVIDLLKEAQSHDYLSSSRQLDRLITSDVENGDLNDEGHRIALADKIEKVNLLSHVISRTRKKDVMELRVVRDPYTYVVKLPDDGEEREFYNAVTNEIRRYAFDKDISDGFLLASPQRQLSSCMYAAASAWSERAELDKDLMKEQVYEDSGGDLEKQPDVSPLMDRLRKAVLPGVDMKALRKNDSKYAEFKKVVIGYLDDHPGEQVVVFSYFRKTLTYLAERIEEDGYKSMVLMGGMKETKQDMINRFRSDKSIRVLLSSEVASEGVDLQFCRVLVNYDLPWNPMKVEQRIGRIDRLGQEADKISIMNLCYEDTIDERIISRLFDRLDIFQSALGDMEAVLGDLVRELTTDLLSRQMTREEEANRIEQTSLAIENIKQQEEELEGRASQLIAHSGYIIEQVKAAYQFSRRVTDRDLKIYVQDYLKKKAPGHTFHEIQGDKVYHEIKLPTRTAAALDDFIKQKKLHGQSRLGGGEKIRCEIVNKVRRVGDRIEQISQFHPMVRFISQELSQDMEAFFPLVALRLRDDLAGVPTGIYVFAVHRWAFSGLRTEEDMKARIISLKSREIMGLDESWDLVTRSRLDGRDWLSSESDLKPIAQEIENNILDCEDQLQEDFQQLAIQKENENSDLVDFQINTAKRHIERQVAKIEEVIDRLMLQNKRQTIPAHKGRIKKLKERFEVKNESLQRKMDIKRSTEEVTMGVIEVFGR